MAIATRFAFMLTSIFSVCEVVSNLQERQEMADQFSQLCPFTAQCHRNATQLLQGNPRVDACCTPCSCHDDCRAMGNCCPDKKELVFKPMQFSCEETLVKRRKDNYSTQKLIYERHGSRIRRYFIVNNCLDNTASTEIANMCSGTKNNSATLENLVWVSDLGSGRIFQNKYCAKCHGVTNIIQWHVVTTCFDILVASVSTAVTTVLSDLCSIIVEVPEKIAAAAEKNLCFLPKYSRCNETGLWDKYDAKLEQSCLGFTSAYLHPFLSGFDIYKNVFCYVCNQGNETIMDKCPSSDTGSKSTTTPFTAVLDYERFTQPMTVKQECGIAEIMHKHNKMCLGLICPFPKTPFYGTCIQLSKSVSGLAVFIAFKIRVLDDLSTSNLNANVSEIGQAIFNAFGKSIGLKRAKCLICTMDVIRKFESAASSPQLFLWAEVLTTSRCQFDRLTELVSGILEIKIKATLPDKSSLFFRVSIDQISFRQLRATAEIMFSLTNVCMPTATYHMQNGKFCPQIEIDRSEMLSFVKREGKSQRWLLKEGMVDEVSNGSVKICVDEYFSTFGQTNRAVFLSLAGRRSIACHFVLGFIVYEYKKLLP